MHMCLAGEISGGGIIILNSVINGKDVYCITTFYSIFIEIIHLLISLDLQTALEKDIFHLKFVERFNIRFQWSIIYTKYTGQ